MSPYFQLIRGKFVELDNGTGDYVSLTHYPSSYRFAQTEVGNRAAQTFGLTEATVSIDESCDGLIKIIDESTKETHGGKLWRFDGVEVPW
jgi:norsolorinic acid ketoreductase